MRTAVIAACLVTCLACGELKEGKIVAKEYQPGRAYLTSTVIGKVVILQPAFDDEDYVITIQAYVNGKTEKNWVEVTKEQYDTLRIGQIINIDSLRP